MVKDDDELNAISETAKITDQIYCEMVTRHVHEGMTEWQAALIFFGKISSKHFIEKNINEII